MQRDQSGSHEEGCICARVIKSAMFDLCPRPLDLHQVPTPLTDNRRRFLAMKWLITECRENKHRRTLMDEKLAQELLIAFSNEGPVVKKKQELHKMAEANRAFAHYRWW